MVAKNVASFWGVRDVQFKVWRDKDKSDIHVYNAQKNDDGTYSVKGDITNHKRHFGEYNVRLYLRNKNGKRGLVSSCSMTMKASNYAYAKNRPSNLSSVIRIINPNIKWNPASEVIVKVWSNGGNKDDVVEYKAKNYSGKKWRATVSVRKHKRGGHFTAQIIVDGKKKNEIIFSMDLDNVRLRLYNKVWNRSSKTGWIILTDKTTHRVGIFKGSRQAWDLVKNWPCGDGKPSTPTPSGNYTVKSKVGYFDSMGDRVYYGTEFTEHYYFHSVTYNPATGKVRPGKQLGVACSHGCVRLATKNAKWLLNNMPVGTPVIVF